MEQQVTDPSGQQEKSFASLLESVNIAKALKEEQLTEIGADVVAGYENDLATREHWDKCMDDWIKLAKQTVQPKSFPWSGASNVKYPLLSTAAMQFAARAYPSLVPSDGRIVKAKAIGKDLDGQKTKTAEAVSIYMSYQLMHEMKGWEEEMDKMLIMLPIIGTMFKKTYWDALTEKNCSRVILPKNLVVNYWTRSLEEAERITEIIEMSPRKVTERQQSGLWLDVDLGDAPLPETADNVPSQDETTPYVFLEQHTFLDLDDDGYPEPYVIIVHKDSKQVLRITTRFTEDSIVLTNEGKISHIKPKHCYTKFGFVPNPDGGFYDIGFGVLLGPINESVNTLINQLIDAGSLNNMQSGFIGKGLRLRMGETKFTLGEWKPVNSTGDDLRKQIVPLPTKEPSSVLFQLMNALITSGKELASVAEIFVGKMPGQNTPATTTMASIEQGMKVFTAVYKRIYRSLAEEFKKLYELNAEYLDPKTYVDVVDTEVGPEDFKAGQNNIFPGADPTAVSQTERLLKAQGLLELLPTGVLDPVKVIQRVLEAQEQPNWQDLFIPQILESGQVPQQPDPKMMEMQMKSQLEQQKFQMQNQAIQQKMELEGRDKQQQMMMKEQEHRQNMQHREQMSTVEAAAALHKQRIFSATENAKTIQNLTQKNAEHRQKLQMQKETPKKGATKK